MHDWLTSLGEDGDTWIGLNDRVSNGNGEGAFIWVENPDTIVYEDGAAAAGPPQTNGDITTYW